MSEMNTVICWYRVVAGKERQFEALLERHWPTLHDLGLVTDAEPQRFVGEDDEGRPLYVEIFEWLSDEAVATAHHHPDVMAIWGPMDELTEERDGNPNMEFPHVRRLRLERDRRSKE